MSGARAERGIWLVIALGALGALAMADGITDSETQEKQISRLESLLEAQQVQVERLQQRLAAGHSPDQDAARVEVMRQQIREVLGESAFRESLIPSVVQAGYDNGFFIKSSDDNFKLKINSYMQFRWTHYATRGTNRYLSPGLQRNDRTGFDLQRVRLIFTGHAWNPNLTYKIHLRADAGSSNDVRLRDAYVNYRFRDELQVQAGMFKIASTQAGLSSDQHLQFVDRPMVDAVYFPGRGVGVRLWGQLWEKRVEYFVDVVNSLNGDGNRTITPDPAELDGNPAIAFRTVWHVLGDNPGQDLKHEADHAHRESPALDLAFHYLFNDDQGDLRSTRIPLALPRRALGGGGFGLVPTTGLQINQFGWAAAFKHRGFSTRGEYILRIVDPRRAGRRPFAPWWLLSGQGSTTVQHGAYVQAGYFLPIPGLERKLEAVVRVGGISALASEQEGTWSYSAGLNYYIEGDKLKIQTDVTKISEVPISSNSSSLANVNDDALVFRVQLTLAF